VLQIRPVRASNAGGLRRDERNLQIFGYDEAFGPPDPAWSDDKAAHDGVAHWVNEYFGLKDDHRISVIKMHKHCRWVTDQYEKHGRLTSIGDEEIEAKSRKSCPKYWEKHKR